MNINMINKLISPTSFCKMLYSTTMTGMERFFAVWEELAEFCIRHMVELLAVGFGDSKLDAG